MPSLREQVWISADEYLEGEKRSPLKHEYVAGRVYAMAGGSVAHNRIAVNCAFLLLTKLRGGPCWVFVADLKIRIGSAEVFYYPDVVVSCHPEDLKPDAYLISHPTLVIEVLSPSTERVDQEEKLLHYRKLDSLHEYVLVSQDAMRVQIYRRAGGNWGTETLGRGERLRLDSVELDLSIEALYENVRQ
ncbi:MAG: Uma2 family endonuclease [Gammaproteobacteria bacterium]